MSTENIVSITSNAKASMFMDLGDVATAEDLVGAAALATRSLSVDVTFRVHGPEGTRVYRYFGDDALAVMSGADPANFEGERIA